jgi:hypothetical protein
MLTAQGKKSTPNPSLKMAGAAFIKYSNLNAT